MTALLEVQRLARSFGKVQAVADVSFALERGQVCGFIGPNGAGKTTTMRILATLDVPDQGDAFVDGVSVLVRPREVRGKVGFMSDQFAPYPNLDVIELLDFFARAHGMRGKQRLDAVRSVASFCGLLELGQRIASGLSKGMGQRLHLAKTLLHDPQLLILDEPASGLDPRARIEFRELIKELAANGKTILISSHILSELGEVCDTVLVIEKGKLMVAGTIAELQQDAGGGVVLVLTVPDADGGASAERFLAGEPQVAEVVRDGNGVTFRFRGSDAERADLVARAVAAGVRVVGLQSVERNLEQIFLHTTRGKLQ